MKTITIQRPIIASLVLLPLGGTFVTGFFASRLLAHATTPGVTLETSDALLDIVTALRDVVIPALVLLTVLATANALLCLRSRDLGSNAEQVAPANAG